MRRLTLGLIASMMLLPVICFAQTNAQTIPKPPDSWVAFQKEENAKRTAFFKEQKADRDAFLSDHPEVKTYLDQMRELARLRMEAWRAAHPPQKTPAP